MENKTIGMAIGAVIVVILMATFLVPICQDVTDMSVAKYNNSDGHFAKASNDSIDHIEYAKSGTEQTYSVNGVVVENIGLESLLITDKFMFKASDNGSNFLTGFNYGRWDNVTSFNLYVGEGKLTGTLDYNGTRTIDESYEYCFYVSPMGAYRAISTTDNIVDYYIKSANDVYFANWTFTTNVFFSGNGEHVRYATYDNVVDTDLNMDPVNGVNGVYTIGLSDDSGDLSFTVDNAGTPYTVHPYFVIVPATVIGEKMVAGFATAGIIQMIPVIVLVALLATVIGGIVVSRNN